MPVLLILSLAVVAALGECYYDTDAKPAPALVITSPAGGTTLDAAHLEVPVSFSTKGFELQEPGSTCSGPGPCGQVELFVDGVTCNPPGQSFNDRGASSPLVARLDSCVRLAGNHQIKLQLVHEDGTPVTDQAGVAITESVMVTVSDGVAP
jgi:hypothetical protein